MKRIGYLGPPGTFSEEAARRHRGNGEGELVACGSLEEVFARLETGSLEEGVVPVENSSEGAVSVVLDMLAAHPELTVRGEVVMQVVHSLLVPPGVKLEMVEKVLSHPQALAQCRTFLRQKLAGVKLQECASTAAAAALAARCRRPWAALAPLSAASRYNLQVLIPAANDCPHNKTRFWALGRKKVLSPAPPCKTSLIFGVRHRPGALYRVLREFAVREINLTRIESRPSKKGLGDYIFFLDFEGAAGDPVVKEMLDVLTEEHTTTLRVLGSYHVVQE